MISILKIVTPLKVTYQNSNIPAYRKFTIWVFEGLLETIFLNQKMSKF